jgi:hypothetical protein
MLFLFKFENLRRIERSLPSHIVRSQGREGQRRSDDRIFNRKARQSANFVLRRQ